MPGTSEASALLRARVTARASFSELRLLEDGSLALRVSSPPAEGMANEVCVRLIASALGVAPSFVSLVRGGASRNKVFRITGLGQEEALARLRGRE